MGTLKDSGQEHRALIIGGQTIPILDELARTGATMLICDYNCDAREFSEALPESEMTIRRNADPSIFEDNEEAIGRAATAIAGDLQLFSHPVGGTGILPYGTDPDRFWLFRNRVEKELGTR
jgi:hypothetical protein